MSKAELTSFIVQVRAKLHDGSYTPEVAFSKVWDFRTSLSYDQRETVHHTLELPFEVPSEMDFIASDSMPEAS